MAFMNGRLRSVTPISLSKRVVTPSGRSRKPLALLLSVLSVTRIAAFSAGPRMAGAEAAPRRPLPGRAVRHGVPARKRRAVGRRHSRADAMPARFRRGPGHGRARRDHGPQGRHSPATATDWTEVPNLWGCIVGRPGTMKSPAMGEALKPLHRLEARRARRTARRWRLTRASSTVQARDRRGRKARRARR